MPETSVSYWNAAAATYDEGSDHGLLDPTVRAAWRALLLEHLPPPPADVVDLGCGTGTLSVLLADEGYLMRGVDSAEEMVSAARQKAATSGVRARFEIGDASDPAYDLGSCDVVLVRHVLWALPDPDAAMRRWVDLLRPGGRLLIIEGSWHTGGGIAMADCQGCLTPHTSSLSTVRLDDNALWVGPLRDERYLVVAFARVGPQRALRGFVRICEESCRRVSFRIAQLRGSLGVGRCRGFLLGEGASGSGRWRSRRCLRLDRSSPDHRWWWR